MLRSAGKYSEALLLAQAMVASLEKTSNNRDLAAALNNLAQIYADQGHDDRAEPTYKRAIALMEKATGLDSVEIAPVLNNLAALDQRQGRFADAEPLFKRALAIREKALSREHPDVGQSLNNLGTFHVKQEHFADAEPLFQRALAIYQKVGGPEHPAVATLLNNLGQFPDYSSLSNPLPLTAKDVQPLLSADEAMVLYSVVDKRSYVIAITRESADWKEIPLGADALAQKVMAFRRGLDVGKARDGSGKSGLFDLALANELYLTLLGRVEALTRDKRSLLTVPSGALTALPFHLLVTETPQAAIPETLEGYRSAAWLLRRQAVSVLPSVVSLKSLRAFAHKDQGIKPMTRFGDPVFNPAEGGSADRRAASGKVAARNVATIAYTDFWRGAGVDRTRLAQALPQLPDTAEELNAVAKDVGAAEADIHLGRDASEATLKRAPLAQYSIIYFATHGLVAGDIKGVGEPSLALSIPDQPSELDDGLLTASEVAQLKLNADWVVLSACNTIAGDKPGAEALSGLARAFFYAGARAPGFALGRGFGGGHPLDHLDFRSAQKRTKNRQSRSSAPGDVDVC